MGLNLTLENNGDSIELSNYLPDGFLREVGSRGFGVAPTSMDMRPLASSGSLWRRSRREARDIDMPVVFFGESASEIEDKMRRMARLLNDTKSEARLFQQYEDGSRFGIGVHLAGGADPQFGTDTNGARTWARWPLTLRCPDPYWVREESQQFSLRASSETIGLLPELSRLRLTSSSTIGAFDIHNDGDVDAYPVWKISGPGTSFSAVRESDGASFTYPNSIGLGETITVDTFTKRVTDQLGVNKYGKLGTAPKLFTIEPGDSTVILTLIGATADSSVSFYFQPRRELVFA